MTTEHELISMLEGCLALAPDLQTSPLGEKIKKAVSRFYQAEALGFETTAKMDEHQAWLKKNGTREYQAWLAGIVPGGVWLGNDVVDAGAEGVILVKWLPASDYDQDACDGAILTTTIGGNGSPFATYDLTICELQDGSFIPMHGSVKMAPVKTVDEAKAVLLAYWKNVPNSQKTAWVPPKDGAQ